MKFFLGHLNMTNMALHQMLGVQPQLCWRQQDWWNHPIPLVDLHMPSSAAAPAPKWLRRWRKLMQATLEFVYMVTQSVLMYASTSLRPRLRDAVLTNYFPPQTATTMLSTTAALTLVQQSRQNTYPEDPTTCTHPNGLRGYGAGARICDLCGSRWVEQVDNRSKAITWLRAQPKASPTSKTPASSSLGRPYGPATSGTGVRLGEHGKGSSRLLSGGELRSGCRDDGRLAGSRRPELCLAGGRRGRTLEQENVEPFVPEDAKVLGYNMFSADEPMTKDDMWQFSLKAGTRKRLAGNLKQLQQVLVVEKAVYDHRARSADGLRNFNYDLVEIYGGMANVSIEALDRGLRVLQPVDKAHGVEISTRTDHRRLRDLLLQRRPFLTIWEIRCDPWSNINHLNYSQDELQAIRDEQLVSLQEVRITIEALRSFGGHFLIENPWGTPFWEQPDLVAIRSLAGAELRKRSMCQFGLRGQQGYFLRKDTGWLSDLPLVLDCIAKVCNHDSSSHEQCLGGNAKRAQVYTKKLANALVTGLVNTLQFLGDMRWSMVPSNSIAWTCGLDVGSDVEHELWPTMWSSTSPQNFTIFYVDIVRDEEAWRPIMQEVKVRLQDRVATSAIVKPATGFFEQIRALVPWTIHQAQIVRNPKARRTPYNLLANQPVTHRAAIMETNDGRLIFETEDLQTVARPQVDDLKHLLHLQF